MFYDAGRSLVFSVMLEMLIRSNCSYLARNIDGVGGSEIVVAKIVEGLVGGTKRDGGAEVGDAKRYRFAVIHIAWISEQTHPRIRLVRYHRITINAHCFLLSSLSPPSPSLYI